MRLSRRVLAGKLNACCRFQNLHIAFAHAIRQDYLQATASVGAAAAARVQCVVYGSSSMRSVAHSMSSSRKYDTQQSATDAITAQQLQD
jgi:hypothetical protein